MGRSYQYVQSYPTTHAIVWISPQRLKTLSKSKRWEMRCTTLILFPFVSSGGHPCRDHASFDSGYSSKVSLENRFPHLHDGPLLKYSLKSTIKVRDRVKTSNVDFHKRCQNDLKKTDKVHKRGGELGFNDKL